MYTSTGVSIVTILFTGSYDLIGLVYVTAAPGAPSSPLLGTVVMLIEELA